MLKYFSSSNQNKEKLSLTLYDKVIKQLFSWNAMTDVTKGELVKLLLSFNNIVVTYNKNNKVVTNPTFHLLLTLSSCWVLNHDTNNDTEIRFMKFLHRMKDELLSYINNIELLVTRLGQFSFNISNKCHLVKLIKKFISSTGLHTVFGLFALQLTAALPFSMRTSSKGFWW